MVKAKPEQRSARRVPAKKPAKVKVQNGVEHQAEANVRDVSLRGVYLYLQSRVSEGSTLELVLPLPEGVMEGHEVWIRCKCRVVRVEHTGREYGVAAIIEEYEALQEAQTAEA